MGEFHCEKHRNRAVLYGSFIAAFSAIFFPLIAWVFINQEWEFVVPLLGITYRPWRLFFIVCGLSGLVCGIIFHYLPESPKYLLGANRHDEALEVLRYMHKKNTQSNKKLQNESFEVSCSRRSSFVEFNKKNIYFRLPHYYRTWPMSQLWIRRPKQMTRNH